MKILGAASVAAVLESDSCKQCFSKCPYLEPLNFFHVVAMCYTLTGIAHYDDDDDDYLYYGVDSEQAVQWTYPSRTQRTHRHCPVSRFAVSFASVDFFCASRFL